MSKFTKLPPGKAIGADDLRWWSLRRRAGRSGVGKEERKPESRDDYLDGITDAWLERAEAAERKRCRS